MTNFITNNLNFDNIYYISGIIILTGGSYLGFKYFISNQSITETAEAKLDKSVQTDIVLPNRDLNNVYERIIDNLIFKTILFMGVIWFTYKLYNNHLDFVTINMVPSISLFSPMGNINTFIFKPKQLIRKENVVDSRF